MTNYTVIQPKRRIRNKLIAAIVSLLAAVAIAVPSFFSALALDNAEKVYEVNLDEYAVTYLTVTTFAGTDETEMNFNWMASARTTEEEQYLEIVEWSGAIPEEFPVADIDDGIDIEITYNESQYTLGSFRCYRATAKNLKPDTRYIYRVGDYDTYSDTYSFTTLPQGDSFNFVVLGDAQLGTNGGTGSNGESADTLLTEDFPSWDKTLKISTEQFDPSFIIHMGDEVESWESNIITVNESEKQYQVFYGTEYTSSYPLISVLGNHEFSKPNWSDHHNNPNQSQFGWTAQGGDQAADFWYVAGNILFLVLNSNSTDYSAHNYFLQEATNEAAEKYGSRIVWTVAMMHHSIFGVNRMGSEPDAVRRKAELAPMFKKYGVDMVLMAHEHVYTRSKIMGGENGTTPLETDSDSAVMDDGILYVTLGSSTGNKCFRANIADKTKDGGEVSSSVPVDDVVLATDAELREEFPYIAYYKESIDLSLDYREGEINTNVGRRGEGMITNVSVSRGKLTISTYMRGETKPFDEFTLYKADPETTVPVISVESSTEIKKGEAFNALDGVTATCAIDGDLTDKITVQGSVDTNKAGTYTLTYSVTNSEGKTATATRTVTVTGKSSGCGSGVSAAIPAAAICFITLGVCAAFIHKKRHC